jgi:hypothetical protein
MHIARGRKMQRWAATFNKLAKLPRRMMTSIDNFDPAGEPRRNPASIKAWQTEIDAVNIVFYRIALP